MERCLRSKPADRRAECREEAREEFEREFERSLNETDRGQSNAAVNASRRAYFEDMQRAEAERAAKAKIEACLQDGSSREVMARCMERIRGELAEEMEVYMRPESSQQQRSGQQREVEKEASREVLGDAFTQCLRGGGARDACKARLDNLRAAAGMANEDTEDVLQRHFANRLADAAGNCTSSPDQCRREAKDQAIRDGMEPRKYQAMKQMGDIRAAANIWASCKAAGETDEACEALARAEFAQTSGAQEDDFDDSIKQRVQGLGRAINNGENIVMVKFKRMLVNAVASGSACSAAREQAFTDMVVIVAMANDSRVERGLPRRCRLVDSRPEYGSNVLVNISDQEIEELSEATAQGLQGRSLSRRLDELLGGSSLRRLDSLDEIYAAQDFAECGESDTACTSDELIAGSPTPAPGGPPTVNGAVRAVWAAAAIPVVCLAAVAGV